MDNWKEYQTNQIRQIAEKVAKKKGITDETWKEGFVCGYKYAQTWDEY